MNNTKNSPTMPTDNDNFISTAIAYAIKLLPALLVGMVAKIANDVRGGRHLSWIGWAAIVLLCICATLLSSWICAYFAVEKKTEVIINCLSTMFSEQIFKIAFINFPIFTQQWVKANLKFALKINERGDKKGNDADKEDDSNSGE